MMKYIAVGQSRKEKLKINNRLCPIIRQICSVLTSTYFRQFNNVIVLDNSFPQEFADSGIMMKILDSNKLRHGAAMISGLKFRTGRRWTRESFFDMSTT
uniref:Uncharacterized protein n=1 Tax=Onchocerca volvulus TaxID=6282 RepID=A0A8R1XT41_ONCVO